jgi:hypothetical protein
MRRLRLLICVALAMIGLSSCAAPALTSGDEHGGLISQTNDTNETVAFSVATAHCQQFGRVAQVTSLDLIYYRMMFACVGR